MLLVYAFWYRHDLVFTLGQFAGLFVYTRNLVLIRRLRGRADAVAVQGIAGPGA